MSETDGTEGTIDYSKMKVNDLKQLLKSRGLPPGGTKQQLIERLQSCETPSEDLLDGSEAGDELGDELGEDLEKELDESSLLIGDDALIGKPEAKQDKADSQQKTEVDPATKSPVKPAPVAADSASKPAEEQPNQAPQNLTDASATEQQPEVSNTAQQKRKISLKAESAVADATDKKKLRAERFGAGADDKPKDVLAKRAERFAINSTTTSTAVSAKTKLPENELLKKRAERFGILSPAELKRQQLEKLQARKLRFSSTSSAAPAAVTATSTTATATVAAVPVLPDGKKPTQLPLEERKKLRAQRFNITK